MRRNTPLDFVRLAVLGCALAVLFQSPVPASSPTTAPTMTTLKWNLFTDKNGLPGTGYVAAVSSASGTPSGTVTFFEGASNLGAGTLGPLTGPDGVVYPAAVYVIGPPLPPGSHTITAVYSGDGSFSGSMTSLTQPVPGSVSTASIVSSINPSPIGGPITFTATLVGQAGSPLPTGSMVFAEGPNVIGTSTLVAAGDHDVATFTTSSLSAGLHAIVAAYAGDTVYAATASAPVAQAVEPASVTGLASSSNPSKAGTAVTFTATVTAAADSSPATTGSVAFAIDGSSVGAVALDGAGKATFTTSTLPLGTHAVTATYLGSASLAVSSASLNQVVNAADAAAFTVSAPSDVTAGAPFSVTVSAVDAFGNPANNYLGTVHFTSTGPGALPADYTFTAVDNGSHLFTNAASLTTAGSFTITATDTTTPSITGTTAAIQVHSTPASITSFTPASGPVGSVVVISGSGFNGVTAVFFSGASASFTVNSDTEIRAIVPAGAATGLITFTSLAGMASSASDFTVTVAPTITTVSPNNVPAGGGGFVLTVNGANFVNDPLLMKSSQVLWNGAARTTTFVSATQLTASILASDVATAGSLGVVTVMNPDSSVSNGAVVVAGSVKWTASVAVVRGTDLSVTFTPKDTGTADANNVQVTAATLGAYGTTTPLPTSAVTITVGNSAGIELHFPGTVGAAEAKVNLTVKFTYNNGATYTFTTRGVTLP